MIMSYIYSGCDPSAWFSWSLSRLQKPVNMYAVLKGEEKARKQNNQINGFLLLSFSWSGIDRCLVLQ